MRRQNGTRQGGGRGEGGRGRNSRTILEEINNGSVTGVRRIVHAAGKLSEISNNAGDMCVYTYMYTDGQIRVFCLPPSNGIFFPVFPSFPLFPSFFFHWKIIIIGIIVRRR